MFNVWFVAYSHSIPISAPESTYVSLYVRLYRAITRNEEVYPEPGNFVPERFWGKMDSEAARHVDAVFWFGRRVCPGQAFAESNIFFIVSNVIATMDLTKAVDEAGVLITPPVEYTKTVSGLMPPLVTDTR